MNLRLSPFVAIILPFFAAVSLTACKLDSSNVLENASVDSSNIDKSKKDTSIKNDWKDISDKPLPEITSDRSRYPTIERDIDVNKVEVIAIDESASLAAHRISESLKNNQARIAADSKDLCPKLISLKVDSNKIERKGEVLKSKYCDYYVYPSKGQKISVESKPNTVSAYLVSPINHDFKNGSYTVDKTDKYIIRLDYPGIENNYSPINYDVSITID